MTIQDKRDAKYREVARLRSELEQALAEAKELDTLIELASKYQVELRAAGEVAQRVLEMTYSRANSTEMSQKERVIEGAKTILSDGVRRLSRELLPELERIGVSIGTRDPAGTLASYLSREKDIFTSDVKAGGWTLVGLQKKARPEDVAASRASVSTAH